MKSEQKESRLAIEAEMRQKQRKRIRLGVEAEEGRNEQKSVNSGTLASETVVQHGSEQDEDGCGEGNKDDARRLLRL